MQQCTWDSIIVMLCNSVFFFKSAFENKNSIKLNHAFAPRKKYNVITSADNTQKTL